MQASTRWRTIPVAALLLLTACAPVTGAASSSPSSEAEYRAVWDANRPASYAYTIERTCFCLPLGPLAVTVQDGQVAAIVTSGGKTLQPDDPRLAAYPISIDSLFDYVEKAEQESDRSQVGYDPTLGYPVMIDVDWDNSIPDDNITIEVSDFR
jgi:hypothetical protein